MILYICKFIFYLLAKFEFVMKHSATAFNKRNLVFGMSPLVLLTLSACGGSSTTGGGSGGGGYQSLSFSGYVVKGPLSNALVGLDYDGDGVVDSSTVRTDTDGNFRLRPTQASYTVIAVTDESTIDASSGTVLSGITLKAPQGASVVTPTTTLMEEGNLTAAQVASVLGLPDGIDPLTFNPFAAGVSASDALAVEKASQQIVNIVNAFASAAEGAGATEEVAFVAALNSLVQVVKTKAAAGGSLDLTDTADLALIKDQAKTDMATTAGVNTTAFNALADDIATAVENVNAKIEAITDTDLTSDASKNIFSTTQVLADQAKTAAEAEVNSGGSGNIIFTDANVVNTAASNKAPTDVALSSNTISEAASSLVIGTLTTTDSDQRANVKFTYALGEITGSDHAAFSINQATGELSLKGQPDFEAKSSYSVTILSTDEGGKTLSKTFTVSIGDTNDAPTIANAIADQTIAEDSALSFQFNSNVFADVDVGDSLIYTATLSDGSALPSWLAFNAATHTFSGTPLNANVGVIAVKVTATDSGSVAITDTFNLTVTNTNDAPTITSTPITTATEGSAYSYTFASSDVDANDTLTYSTSTLPSWLNFNVTTGLLSGTPGEADSGLSSITLTATDAAGISVTQTMKLATTTGSVSVGGSHTGTLDVTGDKDWVAVELTQGQAYDISLSGNSGSYVNDVIEDPDHNPSILNCGCPSCLGSVKQEVKGSEIEAALIDPYIYVYDKDGNLIKSDDDSGSGRDSYLTLTPTYSGTYYVEARAWKDNYAGDYKIEVSEVTPPRPTGALEWGNAAWDTSQTIDVYFADHGVTVSDGTTSTGFTQAEETSMMGMLSNVTNFANISFQITETQAGADIRFAHANLGGGLLGYMNPQNYNSNEGLGVLTNNPSYWNDASMQVGGFMYGVVVHEIGHGLGLAHPHDTGGGSQVMEGVSYSSDKGDYGQMNQSVYTVMSYNEGFAAHPLGLPSDYGSGYMGSFAALDMAVLQSYYGANTSYNNGGTTYGLGSRDYYETIWDGGGTDEVIMSGSSNVVIDLRAATLEYEAGGAGFVSYNADAKGGYTIANGVVIENAKGGSGNDTITGNKANNIIYGGAGAGVKDTLTGNLGADIFVSSIADATTDLSFADSITDFVNGIDKIGLEDRFFSDLSFSNDGGGTKIVDKESSKILFWLDGIDYVSIDSDDFILTDFV